LYSRCSNGFFAICGVLRIKGILKGPQHNHEPFYVCKPLGSFYNAFTLLCPTARLFTMYYISITMYLAMLYWVWCSYHSYVGKANRVKILWHHNEPFGLSLGHSFYFFKGVRPSLNGPICYLRLFRILGFDQSYTDLLFPIRWSPYSSWCDGTCRDRYLSLPNSIMGYLCDVT